MSDTETQNLPAVPTVGQALIQNQNMISRMADSGMTPADMHSLMDLQERMMKTQAEIDYNAALTRVQANMPRIEKNGEIKNKAGMVVARYMKYEDIDFVIRDMLRDEGFAIQHTREDLNQGRMMLVTTTLRHVGGHKESVSIPLPYEQGNALKSPTQAAVSTFSIGKRANVCSLLNIVGADEDREANRDITPITPEQAASLKERLQRGGASPKEGETFLELFGVKSVDDIPISEFEKAEMALKSWEQKKKAVREARGGGQ